MHERARVTVAWVFFRSPTIQDAFGLIMRYFSRSGRMVADIECLIYCALALIPFLCFELLSEYNSKLKLSLYKCTFFRWIAYIIIFVMIVFVGVHDGSSFIYVSF